MNTDKNFIIYSRSKGFCNFDRLNETGKKLYAFLWHLGKNNNDYFHRINNIIITSQDRPEDSQGQSHQEGKAVDFIIKPIEYMPYIMGILSSFTMFNLFLGTVKKLESGIQKNLHIHFDDQFDKRKNKKFYESPDGKLYEINKTNITFLLDLYGFGILESIQNFGAFKEDTIKYLTTYYPIDQKLDINQFTNMTIKNKLINTDTSVFSNVGYYLILSLTAMYIFNKFISKRI